MLVPERQYTVRVTGEVGFPTALVHAEGRDIDWYVHRAGGYLERADEDRARVIHPNGLSQSNDGGHAVLPGSTIVVPVKPPPEGPTTLETLREISAIFASLATVSLIARSFNLDPAETTSEWGPAVYAELLETETLLQKVARDSFRIGASSSPQIPLHSLLEVDESDAALRTELVIEELSRALSVEQLPALGSVRLTVRTRWPRLSYELSVRLVEELERFNAGIRKSQARAERDFVLERVAETRSRLETAETSLLNFLQRNREVAGSPELSFERDRLQRQVALRQEIYTALLQDLEQANIKLVRDTPVISILEQPQIPARPEQAHYLLIVVTSFVAGGILGSLLALLGHSWQSLKFSEDAESVALVKAIDRLLHFNRQQAR